MTTAASHCPFRFSRAAICASVAAFVLLASSGCGGNGKLFGRREKEPPKTVSEWLKQERPQ
ncbi:MAG TPA: hypothetical protein VMV10_28685 [Pirellulales bacterium]|nr:hypothetical protein [Pirellulales bacterium]